MKKENIAKELNELEKLNETMDLILKIAEKFKKANEIVGDVDAMQKEETG